MDYGKGTVFVLGAGFTKGFIRSAPVLVDKFGIQELRDNLGEAHPFAREILDVELNWCELEMGKGWGGEVNLERLMTRLEGGMPYDGKQGALPDYTWLRAQLLSQLLKCLRDAISDDIAVPEGLRRFADHCRSEPCHCITFNYDDLLDRALATSGPALAPQWGPDRGYGFPCKRSSHTAQFAEVLQAPGQMMLLKLHGSVNWRIPVGSPYPYQIDAVVHHERWSGSQLAINRVAAEFIESLLENDPFIVPPILTKAAIVEQPILRILWWRAYQVLKNAAEVVFIGYSMPMTDVGGGFLFRESLSHLDPSYRITVVDYAEPDKRDAKLKVLLESYRRVFPQITADRFCFDGAENWIQDRIPEHSN